MPDKVGTLVEARRTHVAGVRTALKPRVCQSLSQNQFYDLSVCLFVCLTHPGVNAKVTFQVAWIAESSLTKLTDVRLLPRVQVHVHLKWTI